MEMAMTKYGGVRAMAKTWSRIVRTKANNERAMQIRYFKRVGSTNGSLHGACSYRIDNCCSSMRVSQIK